MPDPFWIFFALAWSLEALALGYFMGRRGYDSYAWVVIGFVFGPISLGIALFYVRQSPSRDPVVLRPGKSGPGLIDVLVGVDGSPEADGGIPSVRRLLGSELGSITVAQVIPVDATVEARLRAEQDLARVADEHSTLGVSTVLLRGEPAAALRDYAADLQCELIVVGARGRGRSASLLGSVATALAGGGTLPVLLVSASAPPRQPRTAFVEELGLGPSVDLEPLPGLLPELAADHRTR